MRSGDSDRMVPSLRLDCIDGLGTFDLITIGEVQREEGFEDFCIITKSITASGTTIEIQIIESMRFLYLFVSRQRKNLDIL